ncbi:MAG: hypothetical protein IT324_13855 [Anaerolineae bacterium]|nr:hypothetical protein [Anaerolineae bacterium]
MRVNPFLMPVILIVSLLGVVFVAQAAGAWSVSGRTTVDITRLTPADIKGWMTLQQVIDGIGITKEDLYALVNIPAEIPTSTAIKDMEKLLPGFETSTLRDALMAKFSSAAPAASESATSQPTTQPTVQTTPQPTVPSAASTLHTSPTLLSAGEVLPADQIKGRMSLREVSTQCAVPLDKLLAALNLPPDTNPDGLIKDLVTQGKLAEVASVQQAVAALQQHK